MLETRQLVECTSDINQPLSALNPRDLRQIFSNLTDRCMQSAQSHCLDADDVLLERHAVLQLIADDQLVPIEVDSAIDFSGWLDALNRLRRSQGCDPCRIHEVKLAALRIRVLVEVGAPLWAEARPDRNLL
jgi:hypothetical protein